MKENTNLSALRKMLIKSLLLGSLCISPSLFASTPNTLTVEDFEAPLSGWSSQKNSSIALTTATSDVFSGKSALAWTYLKTGENDKWNNAVRYTFPTPQDWSAFDTFSLQVKSDEAANGKSVRIGLMSDGISMSGTMPLAMIEPKSNAFTAATIRLSSLDKNKLKTITGIVLYVNGGDFKAGKPYLFYIDQMILSNAAK